MTNPTDKHTSNTFRLKGQYVQAKLEGDVVKYWPTGGGFQQQMDATEFRDKAEAVDHIPPQIEEGFFSLDDSPSYPGVHNANYRWNGWTAPYFKKDTLGTIIEAANAGEPWVETKEEDGKLFMKEEGNDEWYEMPSVIHEGDTYYGMDSWCWTKDQK